MDAPDDLNQLRAFFQQHLEKQSRLRSSVVNVANHYFLRELEDDAKYKNMVEVLDTPMTQSALQDMLAKQQVTKFKWDAPLFKMWIVRDAD